MKLIMVMQTEHRDPVYCTFEHSVGCAERETESLYSTRSVSQPPTMLRPRPVRPLEISMVVSQPGMMGQVTGSDTSVAGVDDLLEPGGYIIIIIIFMTTRLWSPTQDTLNNSNNLLLTGTCC